MKLPALDPGQRRALRKEMRVPSIAFAVLMVLLACVVLLAFLAPSHVSSMIELALLLAMMLTMLLFSMELRDEGGVLRFFSAVGFAWVGVLFTFLALDYLTR